MKKQAATHKAAGNNAFSAGRYYAATAEFTKALECDPYDHIFYSNRSACYANLEQFSKACADARRCIELRPDFAKGYSRLGFALFKSGFLHDAMSAYERGLAVDPKNNNLLEGLGEAKVAQKEKIEQAKLNAQMNSMNLDEHVIGIDLGTTYSCVSVWRNGEAHVLTNAEGDRTTPSWVAFTDQGRLVGDAAKRQAAINPKNTLFNIKRIIGRQFSECGEELDLMPFEVKEGEGGKPVVCVDVNGERKEFAPEQISAMVLQKMKATAEAQLGCPITKAVVTVPAYFNDAQRRQTKDAGAIAGLDVLRIINEPTAAALAYGLDRREGENGEAVKNQCVLVFDLGGGTFDVSLLNMQDGVFEVLSTAGDTHLGGEDFDTALASFAQKEIEKERGEDIFAGDEKAARKLRTACEAAKRELSVANHAQIECFIGEVEINMRVTREQFEKACEPIIQRCLDSVKRVLTDAGKKKEEVDEIVLVGGSTRVPRVQGVLTEYFDGKTLNKSVHPDEAVAYGAAVQGAILAGVRDKHTSRVLLMDVVPLSLGVECEGRQFAKVVPRNTAIPCKKKSEFTTVYDNQDEIDVRIFEGERANTDGNHLLGEFQISGIERAAAGEPKIDVTFEVNTNGLLTVTAKDRVTGVEANVSLQHDRGRLTPEQIERMCAEAEAMAEEDERIQRMREYEGTD